MKTGPGDGHSAMADSDIIETEDSAGDERAGNAGAPMSLRPFDRQDRGAGYDRLSVAMHVFTGLALLLLAVTGLRPEHLPLHAAAGLWLAVPLGIIALRRFVRGYPRIADEPMAVSFADRLTLVLILVAVLLLGATGAALSGLDTMAPPPGTEPEGLTGWLAASSLRSWTARLHVQAGYGLAALAVLHMLLALRHLPRGRRKNLTRIIRPVPGGR